MLRHFLLESDWVEAIDELPASYRVRAKISALRRNLAKHALHFANQSFKINMEGSLDPAAGKIDVFPQEITRAFLNLISNGFYAATKRKEQHNSDGYERCPEA